MIERWRLGCRVVIARNGAQRREWRARRRCPIGSRRLVMDTRRLQTFLRVVDVGSLTRASNLLHLAQPALSQQMSSLEDYFGETLLIRSAQGVEPTAAGRALYRHASIILRQLEAARAEVADVSTDLVGRVLVGLAPYSSVSVLALPLLELTRQRLPNVLLHVNENFGGVLSEALMTGRMDMALLYDSGSMKGVDFEPLLTERLSVVAQPEMRLPVNTKGEVDLADVLELPLLLPGPTHTIRKIVESAFAGYSAEVPIVGEVESVTLLSQAVQAGLGATILPDSIGRRMLETAEFEIAPISPEVEVHVSLGTASNQPLSRPAEAVRSLVREVVVAKDS
ncbi:LysR family nitrogen assimilation transcriptional regulator [Prauserella sediminis]|uniref:LysR family nitrogen assimilation transcriptional regulator n=1 Tax=Prauserella sediminis TaxID=577680 RepID=A0A839XSX9_9PSEU|nr:LysR substrate-binding domain-containing protein [Prauserella sediminis]MBB3666310.1 LysR family nitrogen assimilation transcriptional regulator [Prauserella sediminis]